MTSTAAWIAVVGFAVSIAGCADPEPTNLLRVSGHVEATEVQVSPEVGGRILDLLVEEGDEVMAGTVIARLDVRDAELQIRRARAEQAAAAAQVRLLQAGSREEDIRQAEAQVQASQADVSAIQAEIRSARLDLDRFESLLAAEAGSRKQRDDAQGRVDVAQERLRAAQERVQAARETTARFRAGARAEEIEAAQARVAMADAQIAFLEKGIDDAIVTAPGPGIITQRLVEPGEIAAPRVPIVVITDLDNAWANLFVPEPAVPRIGLGAEATVYTDAGGPGLPGTVSFISPRAEFTPRNVQTTEERSKLVYRIKVRIDNRDGILKAGMPVDAEIPLR